MMAEWFSWSEQQNHTLKVGGSNPSSAIKVLNDNLDKKKIMDGISEKNMEA